jgi:hypothetical protein
MATAIKWSDDGLCSPKLGEQPPAQMRPISPEEIATSHAEASGRAWGDEAEPQVPDEGRNQRPSVAISGALEKQVRT